MIKNYTPHPIRIIKVNSNDLITELVATFPPEKVSVRLEQKTLQAGYINTFGAKIPITKTEFGKAENLPEPKDGVYLIVSRLIKTAYPNREDLLVPNEIVRDEEGKTIGALSLASN